MIFISVNWTDNKACSDFGMSSFITLLNVNSDRYKTFSDQFLVDSHYLENNEGKIIAEFNELSVEEYNTYKNIEDDIKKLGFLRIISTSVSFMEETLNIKI